MTFSSNGSCTCGDVTFRVTRAPMFIHCCHCTLCQKQTGSGFVLNALIEKSAVELISGTPVRVETPTESGLPHDVYRCPRCHVALWSDYRRREVLLFVRTSTLDRRAELVPDVHIYAKRKLGWITLPDTARVFDDYYDMQKEWPAESLARRAALGL